MGDSAPVAQPQSGHAARLRWGHGAKQAAYGDWKVSMLGNIPCLAVDEREGAVFHDVQPLAELAELRRVGLHGRRQEDDHHRVPQGADAAGARRLVHGRRQLHPAFEGTPEAHRRRQWSRGDLRRGVHRGFAGQRLVEYLRDTHGISTCKLRLAGHSARLRCFSSPRRPRAQFLELVAPYVHPSMDYKLLPHLRGRFDVEPEFVEPTSAARCRCRSSSITPRSRRPGRAHGSTSRSRGRTTTSPTG